MKALERLGANVNEYWYVWIGFFLIAWLAVDSLNNPKTVTIDAKHWECTLAVPNGIETRCTEYHYRGVK